MVVCGPDVVDVVKEGLEARCPAAIVAVVTLFETVVGARVAEVVCAVVVRSGRIRYPSWMHVARIDPLMLGFISWLVEEWTRGIGAYHIHHLTYTC